MLLFSPFFKWRNSLFPRTTLYVNPPILGVVTSSGVLRVLNRLLFCACQLLVFLGRSPYGVEVRTLTPPNALSSSFPLAEKAEGQPAPSFAILSIRGVSCHPPFAKKRRFPSSVHTPTRSRFLLFSFGSRPPETDSYESFFPSHSLVVETSRMLRGK